MVSPIFGYVVYFTVGPMQGIIASGWVSLVQCVGLGLASRPSYDRSILHDYGKREVGDME